MRFVGLNSVTRDWRTRIWWKINWAGAERRGMTVINTRWLHTNKGDKLTPNYRSRFVGKECNDGKTGETGWFAATRLLEALKLFIRDFATIGKNGRSRSMMISDVARFFFEARVQNSICIELSEQDWEAARGTRPNTSSTMSSHS